MIAMDRSTMMGPNAAMNFCRSTTRVAAVAFSLFWMLCSPGCVSRPEDAVVIYSAADREYASPILAGFSRRFEGVEVVPQFDVESTKTVGLVTRIESESSRPRCDVLWNNEIMHTLRLEQAGLLQPIDWDITLDWPSHMRSSSGNWVGIGARARVLLVNRELLPAAEDWPGSVSDLADPKWQGKCGLALPLFGTTATHFAVLRSQLGDQKSADLFKAIQVNAVVLSGNKQVAQAVSSGRIAFGLTDTDDALIEMDAGLPVEIVFPDQEPQQPGALRIPNTVAVIADCPHPVAAAALANYLVSEDTEGRLAMGPSGQFPVRPGHPQQSRAQGESQVRWMAADFAAAAENWPALSDELRAIFRE
jgi:iron(III) transport system substrate-binding protein